MARQRLIVGITGASGAAYGVQLLQALRTLRGWESHLVLTEAGALNCWHELQMKRKDVERLAHAAYHPRDIGATLASGSFLTAGMVIAPCSIKTLSGIVHSAADSLLVRAADVVLKEQRRLVLMPREAPLHVGHCKLLYEAAQLGAVIAPPMPAFYNQPKTIDDLVNHSIGRVLDLFDLDAGILKRWEGPNARSAIPLKA